MLTKRAGLKLGGQDILVNVIGGLKVSEPAADLGIALALASSFRDSEIDPSLAAIGEVGLSGELRAVSQLDRRVAEVARLGFKKCLVPKTGLTVKTKDIELVPAATLREAVNLAIKKGRASRHTAQDGS